MVFFGAKRYHRAIHPMIDAALGEGRLRLYFGIVLPWPFIASLLRAASRIDIHKRLPKNMSGIVLRLKDWEPSQLSSEVDGQDFRFHSHIHESSHKLVFKGSL